VGGSRDDPCEGFNRPIGGNDTCGSPKLTSMTEDFSLLVAYLQIVYNSHDFQKTCDCHVY
jgi:hypothetical protein